MAGQHGAGEIVETECARLATVTLTMRLRVVAPVSDNRGTGASRAAHTFRPAVLAHKRKALGIVHQPERLTKSDAGLVAKAPRTLQPSHQIHASGTTRITTPEPDKSLRILAEQLVCRFFRYRSSPSTSFPLRAVDGWSLRVMQRLRFFSGANSTGGWNE